MMKNAFFLLVTSACVLLSIPGRAADTDEKSSRKEQLTQELARVRSDLAQAQTDLTSKSKELWQEQHDMEYNDPSVSRLREDIVNLEKQIIEKRKELNTKLSLKPGMKSIESRRAELFTHLQSLKETEQAILNEIAAADHAAGVER